MIRIDLLPKEERVRRRRAPKVPAVKVRVPVRGGTVVGIGVALIVVFAMIFFYIQQTMEVKRLTSEISGMRAELRELAQEVKMVQELTEKQDNIKLWLGVIEELNKNRFLRAHLLDELATLLPEYSWLSALIESDLGLTIEGRAFSNLIVADLMLKLMRSPYFQNVDLSFIKRGAVHGHDVMDFKLTGSLVPYQPSSPKGESASSGSSEGGE